LFHLSLKVKTPNSKKVISPNLNVQIPFYFSSTKNYPSKTKPSHIKKDKKLSLFIFFIETFPFEERSLYLMLLFTQIHTPILIQLPEIRIPQIFDKADGFSRTFHFWTQFLFTPGNLLKLKTGSLIANPLSFFSNLKSFSVCPPIIILVATFR